MKLLHVVATLDPGSGGPAEFVRQSGVSLKETGHIVEVVTLDSPSDFISQFPLRVHALGSIEGTYRFTKALVPWLRSYASNYDAVIIDGIWQYNCWGTWRALRHSKTPFFVMVHGMLDPWFKRAYPLKHLKKWLYWPWGVYPVLRDARAVLYTCEEERLLARKSFWLYCAREKVVKFGTACPPPDDDRVRGKLVEKYPELRERRIILFLSRLHPKKGCDLLIKAFARVQSLDPRLHLVFAGPGEVEFIASLRALAITLGIANRITWTGMLVPPMKWAAFYSSEVFALPSHQENFGIAIAEALACGVPVLISDKVNIWREIEEAGAGYVASDSVEGTELSLRKWLSLNAQKRDEMKGRAEAAFAKNFTLSAMNSSMVETICG